MDPTVVVANRTPANKGRRFPADPPRVDEIIAVTNEGAVSTSRELAVKDAILGGISAGANVKAALELAAREENAGKTIVVIIPDFGERYVSTVLYEDIRD